MKYSRRIFISIAWVIIGAVLVALSTMDKIDSIWCGFGGGLIGVGIVQVIRHIRYASDPEYKEKFDIAASDERNAYIRMKAWSWTGYIMVLASGVATVVFMILGLHEYMMASSVAVGAIVVVYWITYIVLRNKY